MRCLGGAVFPGLLGHLHEDFGALRHPCPPGLPRGGGANTDLHRFYKRNAYGPSLSPIATPVPPALYTQIDQKQLLCPLGTEAARGGGAVGGSLMWVSLSSS